MDSPLPSEMVENIKKRGIAGSLIFAVFDRVALLASFQGRPEGEFYGRKEDARLALNPGDTIAKLDQRMDHAEIVADRQLIPPSYVDQIPPFTVVLTAANELGAVAKMEIRGVQIMNEGMGMSIDDIMTEQQCTFVAREIHPWLPTPRG